MNERKIHTKFPTAPAAGTLNQGFWNKRKSAHVSKIDVHQCLEGVAFEHELQTCASEVDGWKE